MTLSAPPVQRSRPGSMPVHAQGEAAPLLPEPLLPEPRREPLRRRLRPFAITGAAALLIGCALTGVSRVAHLAVPPMRVPSFYQRAGHVKDCRSDGFVKETLKLVAEEPVARLVGIGTLQKYEASGVAGVPGGDDFYVVLDNSFRIGRFRNAVTYRGDEPNVKGGKFFHHDKLLTWKGDNGSDSQFEFLSFNETGGNFLVGQEMVVHAKGKMKAHIYEVKFGSNETEVGEMCETEYEFSHDNKGFEGGAVVTAANGQSFLLALCEGNFCAGGWRGRKPGNGRIMILQRGVTSSGKCIYRTVEELQVPAEANFRDYSALTVWQNTTVAIASQENSAVYVTTLIANKDPKDGLFSWGAGTIYDFPRNDACEIKYCNIEGVMFLGPKTLVAVSDAMKKHQKQSHRCREKDEAVHLFEFP